MPGKEPVPLCYEIFLNWFIPYDATVKTRYDTGLPTKIHRTTKSLSTRVITSVMVLVFAEGAHHERRGAALYTDLTVDAVPCRVYYIVLVSPIWTVFIQDICYTSTRHEGYRRNIYNFMTLAWRLLGNVRDCLSLLRNGKNACFSGGRFYVKQLSRQEITLLLVLLAIQSWKWVLRGKPTKSI